MDIIKNPHQFQIKTRSREKYVEIIASFVLHLSAWLNNFSIKSRGKY